MDLRDWQSHLRQHFRNLREIRSAEIGERPIFALEHGLDEQETTAVSAAVHSHILTSEPLWEHFLPWVVYATEIGYLFSGDEYWQTFEERTPGWLAHGDRHWLRRCFREFHQLYGGAEPTGPWARQFSIICWPITHAILPRDLQRQLAKSLFELRHDLTPDAVATPRRLGELIACRSWGSSSRFQQLAQEPLLIGQIAAALLLKGDRRASSLILPATLSRIGQDLDRERRSRTWIRSAQESAQRYVRFQHGVGTGRGRASYKEEEEERVRKPKRLSVEPRLVLKPTKDRQWGIMLEVPDFAHVPARFPALKDSLFSSRCRVSGSSGRPLARGRLMYGPQKIPLKQWPPDDKPLLEFEQSTPELDNLLNTECFLRSGPTWLFKVASDGLAYELRQAHARAGNRYVLLSRHAPTALVPPHVTAAVVQCEGINGVLLDLPEALTPELSAVLKSLGVPEAGTLEIWPAGLMPTRWDGDGSAEWLSTEIPCVGLRADHHVEAFLANLDTQTLEIQPEQPGEPVFIELPRLGVGQHTLRVSPRTASREPATDTAVLDIQIREPRGWMPGSGSQSALLVIVDPSAPTLEQLWEGHVDVEVHGPRGRYVECCISLYRKRDTLPYLECQLQKLKIPVKPSDWRTFMEIQVTENREVQNAYDLAHKCEMRLGAGELGAFTLAAEREFTPLRWAVCRKRQSFRLRALDDTGEQPVINVQLYEFNMPDRGQSLDASPFCFGDGAEVQGGLYVARAGGHRSAVIIPPEVHSLMDLRLEPRFLVRRRTSSDIVALIWLLELWASARLTGGLGSRTRRRQVLKSVLEEIFRLICGNRWSAIESRLQSRNMERAVQEATHAFSRLEADLGLTIARDAQRLATMTAENRALRLAQLGRRFLGLSDNWNPAHRLSGVLRPGAVIVRKRRADDGPDHPAWLSEFTLRLASSPVKLSEWAGEHIEDAIERLLEIPALARAARFMVLIIRRRSGRVGACSDSSSEGWDWP